MAVCQNLVPLVNIKIAGKWMFIPLKMVLIGIDPYPYVLQITVAHPRTCQPSGTAVALQVSRERFLCGLVKLLALAANSHVAHGLWPF